MSEDDLRDFMNVWPCSGLHGLDGVTFDYDGDGNLVDVSFTNGEIDEWDGEGLTALSQDAQDWSAATDPQDRRVMRDRFRQADHFPWWWRESWGR